MTRARIEGNHPLALSVRPRTRIPRALSAIVLGGAALVVAGGCATAPAGSSTGASKAAAPASWYGSERAFAPAVRTDGAWQPGPQDPKYPTAVQQKFGLPDVRRPREAPRAHIGVFYEDIEFGSIDHDAGKVENVDRTRLGLRFRYGEDSMGVYGELFSEEFGDNSVNLFGAGLGIDGKNRWIEFSDDFHLVLEYGLAGGYHFGKDTPDNAPAEVGVYYVDVDLNGGIGLELGKVRLVGGYHGNWIPWGIDGVDMSLSDSFGNGKTFDAMNNAGYGRLTVDLEPIYLSGEYRVGDIEGFWVDAGVVW